MQDGKKAKQKKKQKVHCEKADLFTSLIFCGGGGLSPDSTHLRHYPRWMRRSAATSGGCGCVLGLAIRIRSDQSLDDVQTLVYFQRGRDSGKARPRTIGLRSWEERENDREWRKGNSQGERRGQQGERRARGRREPLRMLTHPEARECVREQKERESEREHSQ